MNPSKKEAKNKSADWTQPYLSTALWLLNFVKKKK